MSTQDDQVTLLLLTEIATVLFELVGPLLARRALLPSGEARTLIDNKAQTCVNGDKQGTP